jgi:S1-C subfamily serine protease
MTEETPDNATLARHIGFVYERQQRNHRVAIRAGVILIVLIIGATSVLFVRVSGIRADMESLTARLAAADVNFAKVQSELHETTNELVATKSQATREAKELATEIATVRRERHDDPLPAIAERMKDAVALIICQTETEEYTSGSGTIFTSNGLVLTNLHVLPETSDALLPCALVYQAWEGDGGSEVFGLEYVSSDDARDLAVVKIVDEEGMEVRENRTRSLESLQGIVCDDDDLAVARSLLILGYPNYGDGVPDPTLASLKVTAGKISSLLPDGDVITDAKLEHGNSGGAAFLDSGCFIGVPTAVLTGRVEALGVIRRISNTAS